MKDAPTTINTVEISFWLNGKAMTLAVEPELTTLELLHEKLRLYGSKSSCNEGDCGACTVIIAQVKNKKVNYQTFNSCIYPAVRLHGKHLITVEGITVGDELHPVQTALLDEHGTQCGFCTPGFVMSILGLYLNSAAPGEAEILAALEGNLCRCTGYDSIMKAAHLAGKMLADKQSLLPAALWQVETSLLKFNAPVKTIETANREGWSTAQYLMPHNLNELWDCMHKAKGQYKLITGGTDLMVAANIQHIHYPYIIDLCDVEELNGIKQQNNKIYIGANTTMTELLHSELIIHHYPILVKVLSMMASTQIRNSATLAGNIANASPVADGATALLALDASIVLDSRTSVATSFTGGQFAGIIPEATKERTLKLADCYNGYKQTELKADEIIKAIVIPIAENENIYMDAIKSAKRKAVDISSVVSVINLTHKKGRITKAVLSFGGVAPYPALAKQTMAFLTGKEIKPDWFEAAAELAQSEFTPISDVRGKDDYRSILIKNHILKYLKNFLESGVTL